LFTPYFLVLSITYSEDATTDIDANDLPDWIVNDMRMFADDTKLWSKISGLS